MTGLLLDQSTLDDVQSYLRIQSVRKPKGKSTFKSELIKQVLQTTHKILELRQGCEIQI